MVPSELLEPSAAEPPPEQEARPVAGREIELVRFRLVLVVMATALISVLAGAVVLALVAPDPEHHLSSAIHAAPVPWLLAIAVTFAVACDLTLFLARRVVRPAEELDTALRRYGELYRFARERALEDSLTGLGNHRAFHEEFDRQLDACRRYGTPVSLLLIDLDDFKTINDSAGHAVGDQVLVEMGRLLATRLRRSDRSFRVGGDEFAVLMPHTQAEDAYAVAHRLLSECVTPRAGSFFPRSFSFSAGITSAPAMGSDRAELLARADEALYDCKHAGRTGVKIYEPARGPAPRDEPSLRRAASAVVRIIETGGVIPAYQPIVDLRTGRVVGFEGLVRPAPGSGFDDPSALFAVAETTGRSADLDRLCLETVISGAGALARDQALSLNVSPQTLEAPEFSPPAFAGALRAADIDPGRVVLELTERQAVHDIERLRRRLVACQAQGIRVAIDDVGAGNSGLRLLSQIHFDIVKIDLSLVQAGARRDASLDVVRSLVDLAGRWGAVVVAEGIETPTELRLVQKLGLTEAQGYLLGRPGPLPNLRWVDLDALMHEPDLRAILTAGTVAGAAG